MDRWRRRPRDAELDAITHAIRETAHAANTICPADAEYAQHTVQWFRYHHLRNVRSRACIRSYCTRVHPSFAAFFRLTSMKIWLHSPAQVNRIQIATAIAATPRKLPNGNS